MGDRFSGGAGRFPATLQRLVCLNDKGRRLLSQKFELVLDKGAFTSLKCGQSDERQSKCPPYRNEKLVNKVILDVCRTEIDAIRMRRGGMFINVIKFDLFPPS